VIFLTFLREVFPPDDRATWVVSSRKPDLRVK
jgi:hypothetical protein